MALLIIIILIVIIFVLNVILIHKSAQVSSLKNQVAFLEYSLEQLTEKEKNSKQDPEKSRFEITSPDDH
jgi:predicted Holliday junction resolvase-like endonuclease